MRTIQRKRNIIKRSSALKLFILVTIIFISLIVLAFIFLFTDKIQNKPELILNSTHKTIQEILEKDKGKKYSQAFGSPFIEIDWRKNITSKFGERNKINKAGKEVHTGVDIAMEQGTPINAVLDGEVILVEKSETGYGYHFAINSGKNTISLYAHCSEILVEKGQKIKRGDVVGKVGTTGNSTGNHLHIEVIKDGVPINPEKYLKYKNN